MLKKQFGGIFLTLEIRDICKSFSGKKVLHDVCFSAKSGDALGILGRNGAGKSTTIRIIMGVFLQDSGTVLIDGKEINRKNIKFGYLPEERGLYPKVSIFDQLVYFTKLKGVSKSDAVKSVEYWLERLEMSEHKNKKLSTLSKGNQQKIQLITAISANPDLVILDEPFSGLDPVNSMLLKDVVKELITDGKIVLFSSHQMSYVEEFCSSIAIINEGQIKLHGGLSEIIRNYPRNKLEIFSDKNDLILSDYKDVCEFEKGRVIFNLNSPDQKLPVMRELLGKYDIDRINVLEPSLNEIFIEYTKDAI